MKLEKFELEYMEEIGKIQSLHTREVAVPAFQIPSYKFVYKKALSIAFALPALAFAFAFFFYIGENSKVNGDLAQLEASNNRIINQIDSLDHASNI
jgi:hypothetical protein